MTFTIVALREFGFGKKSIESKIIEEVELLMKIVDKERGLPFSIKRVMTVCLSNIVSSISFGRRFEHEDEYLLTMLEKMDQTLSNPNVTLVATFFPFIQHIPGDPFNVKQTINDLTDVDNHLLKMIEEHESSYDANNTRDYIDLYIKRMLKEKEDPNSTFDSKELNNFICMGAGIRYTILI